MQNHLFKQALVQPLGGQKLLAEFCAESAGEKPLAQLGPLRWSDKPLELRNILKLRLRAERLAPDEQRLGLGTAPLPRANRVSRPRP